MFRHKFLAAAIVAVLTAIAAPSQSDAAFQLRLTDTVTGDSVTITDQGAGDASLGAGGLGIITFAGSIGGTSDWVVNISTGRSKPNVGSATQPELRLTTTNMTSLGAGTLKIEVSDTDFGPTNNPLSVTTISNSSDGLTGNVDTSAYIDLANSAFNTTTQIGSTISGSGVYNVTQTASVATDGQFSLNLVTVLTHTSAHTSQFDSSLTTAPAPAGLILATTAVPFIGLLRRRMRKAEPTTAA